MGMFAVLAASAAAAGVGDEPCHSISPSVTDQWCESNCHHSPPNCPADLCVCGTPAPPQPPQPPTPAPPLPPLPPPGNITGYFLAPFAASAQGRAPRSGVAIYFWGNDPQTWYTYYKQSPASYTAAVLLPGDGYALRVLNLGGGGTQWDDAQIAAATEFIPKIKSDLGFDGVCLDTEVMGRFSMPNFLAMFAAAKAAGLVSILTTTAEGPYVGCDSPDDCWASIRWDDIDYIVPQMYGASGGNYPTAQLQQYADFWRRGGGQGVHGKFPGPADLNKVVWGLTTGTGASVQRTLGFGAGYIDWAYKSL